MPLFCRLLLLLLLCLPVAGQKISIATEDDIKNDIALAPCKNADRLAAVEKLFRAMGATDADLQILEKKRTRNLLVTKKGTGTGTIIVGAHYDKVADGCGALDNWTGIVNVAHLYGTLRQIDTAKTFEFVAFDREEEGLIGSDVFVGEIPKPDRPSICSMVNLDSFGVASVQVMENTSTPKLTGVAKAFWKKENLELHGAVVDNADADSTSFLHAGIPAITFHALDGNWPQYLHSSNDQVKKVNAHSVFLGYRLILPFLVELDSTACDAMRNK